MIKVNMTAPHRKIHVATNYRYQRSGYAYIPLTSIFSRNGMKFPGTALDRATKQSTEVKDGFAILVTG
jgi:hypothetical protein